MATRYHNIVFLQGESADEVFEMMRNSGMEYGLEYLRQWDQGEESEHSPTDSPEYGPQDHIYESGPYILSYDPRLTYIGLTRKTHHA